MIKTKIFELTKVILNAKIIVVIYRKSPRDEFWKIFLNTIFRKMK